MTENHRDHLEGGAATETGGEEQAHKHHVEGDEAAGTAARQRQEQQAGKDRHQHEVHQRHLHAAETIGNHTAE